MKNKAFQAVAALMAFFIGVAVNSSCGDSVSADEASLTALWNQVKTMQAEIDRLKTEIANLKNGGDSSSASNGEFEVDGLWFDMSGWPCSKYKEYRIDFYSPDYDEYYQTNSYEYDKYGRRTKYTYKSHYIYKGNGKTYDSESVYIYEYNGRTVTFTCYNEKGEIASKGTSIYY